MTKLIGRNRALEVLLSSEDPNRGDQAEVYGYVNRALPDADLDAFATRIASSLTPAYPPEVELRVGWDVCRALIERPAAQEGIKALMERGFHKPGNIENRLRILPGPNRALGRPLKRPGWPRLSWPHRPVRAMYHERRQGILFATLHDYPMIHPTQQIVAMAEQEKSLWRLVCVCEQLRREPQR